MLKLTWRKFHIAVNPDGMETVAIELTEANVHDDSVMADLLQNQTITGKVFADGAYISKGCFDAIAGTGGGAAIALRTGTGLVKKNPSVRQSLRNKLIQEIQSAILGANLASRWMANQITEAKVKTLIVNEMPCTGMPRSYVVK